MVVASPVTVLANDALVGAGMMMAIRAIVAALLTLWLMPALAIDRLEFSTENIQGADWRAEGLQWTLQLQGDAHSQLTIKRLKLPDPYGELTALHIDCPGLVIESGVLDCPKGRATAKAPWLENKPFIMSFRYEPARQQLALTIQDMPAFGGSLGLQASYGKDWTLDAQATQIAAGQLALFLPAIDASLKDWQFAGQLDASVKGNSSGFAFSLGIDQFTCSDAGGHYASEGLKLSLTGTLQRKGQVWQGQVTSSAPAGQVYIEPVFADLSAYPAQLTADFSRADNGDIHIATARLVQDKVMEATASGDWGAGQLQTMRASVKNLRLASAYELYAKPYLLGTVLEALQTAGKVDLDLEWSEATLQIANASLHKVVIEDAKGRFAWDGLQGDVYWRKSGEVKTSKLNWAGAAAHKLLLGPSSLEANLAGKNVSLLQPMVLPLLEGALVIKQFRAQNLGSPEMALQFDGEVQPLSLEALTTAFSWPRFGGKLSGRLPDLDYRGGVLTLGGALQAQVFDGEVRVENLRIQDPFGRLPQLFADLRLRNLDLEAVTQAFSFGRIQGRLDGDVEKMQMLNWQPVAFDASLITPEDDKSRHRISQRAIENISAIGGGGAGALLSRGFLQFFEDFAYDRIGLTCRLRGNVCQMGGLGPSKDGNGYILVKGRLLPRIDVIGYAHEVDWTTLVEQLKSVTKGEGPVVQ